MLEKNVLTAKIYKKIITTKILDSEMPTIAVIRPAFKFL
jgi:hypothetical protein